MVLRMSKEFRDHDKKPSEAKRTIGHQSVSKKLGREKAPSRNPGDEKSKN